MESHPPHIDHHKSKYARQVLNKWRQAPWTMARELVVDMIPVVLGILLALGINNWNHARTEHEQEIIYLHQIADDLRADVGGFELYNTRLAARSPAVDGYADLREQFILPVLFKLRRTDTFRTAQNFAPFVNDPYFQNLLGFVFYNEIVGKYERVIRQQKKLITLIDEELRELD